MRKRELLKQLHNLKKEIKPDLEWQKTNRDILMSQIKAQTIAKSHKEVLFANISWQKILVAVSKPVGALAIIGIVMFSTYIATVAATKNSVPGDFLYPVKITAERAQINMAGTDEKKTNLEISFAQRRLDEIKIVTGKSKTDENKKENLDISLKSFQESINNIKTNLAKLEITDKQLAVKVADMVNQKTQEYIGILKDQKGTSLELTQTKETQEAISVSKATGDKALNLIVKEFESGESDLIVDQVKEKINSRMIDLEKNLISDKSDIALILINKKIAEDNAKAEAETKAKADAEAAKAAEANNSEEGNKDNQQTDANTNNSAPANTNSAPETTTQPAENITDETAVPEEVLPTIEEIKDKPKEIEALLVKAKGYLASNSVSQAFEMVRQADDIMTLMEKVIEANKQYLAPTPSVSPPQAGEDGMKDAVKMEDKV